MQLNRCVFSSWQNSSTVSSSWQCVLLPFGKSSSSSLCLSVCLAFQSKKYNAKTVCNTATRCSVDKTPKDAVGKELLLMVVHSRPAVSVRQGGCTVYTTSQVGSVTDVQKSGTADDRQWSNELLFQSSSYCLPVRHQSRLRRRSGWRHRGLRLQPSDGQRDADCRAESCRAQ